MDGLRFYQRNTRTLVIWFGGINEPYFSEKLSSVCNVDLIAVLDTKCSWYTEGFHEVHESYEDGLATLRCLIEENGFEKIILCGQSSGGYAALRFAIDLKPELVFVFSPQTRNSFDGQCRMCPHVNLLDLGDIYQDNLNTRLVFNMSRTERDHQMSFRWDDWWHVEKFISHPKATFITHPFDNHSVSVKIREEMDLYKYVNGMLLAFGVI